MNCLNDQDTKVRYTAATALAAYLKHNGENTQLLNVYRDCLPCFLAVSFTIILFEIYWIDENVTVNSMTIERVYRKT